MLLASISGIYTSSNFNLEQSWNRAGMHRILHGIGYSQCAQHTDNVMTPCTGPAVWARTQILFHYALYRLYYFYYTLRLTLSVRFVLVTESPRLSVTKTERGTNCATYRSDEVINPPSKTPYKGEHGKY